MRNVCEVLISALVVVPMLTPAKIAAKPTTSTLMAATTSADVIINSSTLAVLDLWEHVNKTCLSHECSDAINLQHLHMLGRNMNREADPCVNFHEYACGNWRQERPRAATMMKVADETLTERYVELFERSLREEREFAAKMRGRGKEFVYKVEAHTQEPDLVYDKMLNYYRVCVESERADRLSMRGYFEVLRNEGVWRSANADWLELLALLGRYGNNEHFLRLRVMQRNATNHAIEISPHNRRERLKLNKEIYDILREFTTKELTKLESEFAMLEDDLADILVGICEDDNGDCDHSEVLTFAELSQQCSDVDWQRFLGLQLGRTMRAGDLIVIDDFAIVRKLARYLNAAKNSNLVALYSLARFFNQRQNELYGILNVRANGHNCIYHMRKTLYLPMTYIYERSHYAAVRPQSDAIILSVFNELKSEFANLLRENSMNFEADILEYIQRKLRSLRINIGNLPLNVTREFYWNFVRNLNFTDNFYCNHLVSLQHSYMTMRSFAYLPKRSSADSPWHSFNYRGPNFPDNIDSTPFYFCLSNMIIVPHSYLQRPFYDHNFWAVLIYGDLATTLGHELIHAFDNTFLQYDQGGNLNDLYVRIEENSSYQRNLACLEEGTEFLHERIADISGTHLALNAFMKDRHFLERNGKLFFLQFAQFFCGGQDVVSVKRADPLHDLNSLRLNSTLAHTKEFADVFRCRADSPMNAAVKCKMW